MQNASVKRFPKLRKFLRWTLIVFLVLFFGGWVFENWRGAKAWEKAQARAEKAGLSLVRADYAGPEIPDDENLLKDPAFLKEFENEGEDRLGAWRNLSEVTAKGIIAWSKPATGEVLEYAKYFEEELSEEEARVRLREATGEVEARLDKLSRVILTKPEQSVSTKSASNKPLSEIGEGIGNLSNFTKCFQSSALMAIRSGDHKTAMERIKILERGSTLIDRPALIHLLIGNVARSMNDLLIWEGVRLRVWSDEELVALSVLLESRDYKKSFLNAIQFEAAFGVEGMDYLEISEEEKSDYKEEMTWVERLQFWLVFEGVSGWKGQRKALLVNKYLDLIESVQTDDLRIKAQLEEGLDVSEWSPMAGVAMGVRGIIFVQPIAYERSETRRRIALMAIALERRFLARNSYPSSLAELDLKFPVTDLSDPDRRDLAYELGPDGRPVIWSEYEDETVGERSVHHLRWQYYREN